MRYFYGAAFALSLAAWAIAARADAPPLRHLVYSFTYESRQHGNVPNDAGSSGARTYNGTLDDQGTMTVDVLREAQDRGLVVLVSEQGQGPRRADPATCAVYGNTTVVCEPKKIVNAEELTLLRFLGANFFDPSALDAKQSWSVSDKKGGTTMAATYTVTSNTNGVMKISETRHVESTAQGSITVDTQTKIDYDFNRLLPTAIDEYATEDQHSGVIGVSQTTYQTTYTLVSDSMAKKTSP
ncbi:MAG TPA: hypothetical protein VHX17_00370 [Candidatus Cybelea sp.]|jgi:hypothetical protein|nr:hypothetical protein [Candidatus Cybelea sp.]